MGKGRQVVYCDGCGRILKEEEFDQGRAHTIDNRNFCVACRPLEAPRERPPGPIETPRPFKQVSSTRLPALSSSSSVRAVRQSSHENPRVTTEARPGGSSKKALLFGGGAAALLVLLFLAFSSGGGPPTARIDPHPPEAPTPPPPRPPEAAPPSPGGGSFEPGKAELDQGLGHKKTQPLDLTGQMRAFLRASEVGGNNPFGEQARREIAQVNLELQKQLSGIEEKARIPFKAEQFKVAQDLWADARKRHQLLEWTDQVALKIEEVQRIAAGRYSQVREKAVDARKRNDAAELKSCRERVAQWGLEEYSKDLERVLAEVQPDAPAPPAPPAPAKGAEALGGCWKEAMKRALARDYAGAEKVLAQFSPPADDRETKAECAADLENLKLAGLVAAEGYLALSKLPKGQKIKLAYLDPSGQRAQVEGVVLALDPGRLEVKVGESSVTVPLGEVQACTLAECFKSRPKKADTDGLAAALFCLIEGDADAAKRLQGDSASPIKPKYTQWASAAKEPVPEDPKEAEARQIYYLAEILYPDAPKSGEAVLEYRTLLKDFAQTAFVRRNRAALEARREGWKDIIVPASELSSRGSFKLLKLTNKPEALVSQKDVETEKMKDHYVQVEFFGLADCEYKGWAYVGGCCQEVMTFAVQGTDLSSPNPKKPQETVSYELGGSAFLPVKLPSTSLKRKHSDHVGPKEPDKWEWVSLPVPRYSSPGPKTIRLLSDQKGFSVAYIVLSAQKNSPPREFEIRDLEKLRTEVPGYAELKSGALLPAGKILWEAWEGVGGLLIKDLTSNPNFPDKPTKSDYLTKLDGPVDWGDNYGTRIRGYLHPPATGLYTLWVSGDDTAELWLSPDDKATGKVKIAFVPSYTGHLEWEKFGEQKSQPIQLRAGRRYYVEVLHKESTGGDHVAVGWQLPDGSQERPISGNRLSPFKK